ncbi:hypothetical protein [Nocardioides plantarum]|uniref:Choice-of-anchor D domain-containing protein n=1 Tax=Nocardioides plantarum TaxID=29299 RepID=A0ABV5K7T7_9ACTN|nr:hypothetical protein [Nocardioides plantarum]
MIASSRPVIRHRRPHSAGHSALVTLAVLAAGGAVLAPSAPALSAEPSAAVHQVRVTQVYAASTAVPAGTQVRTSLVVRSTSPTRQPRRTLRLYLAGAAGTYGLTTARTPSLAPGARATVRTTGLAPAKAPAGRYAVRACLGPLGSQVCRLSNATVTIAQAPFEVDPSSYDYGEVAVGASSTMTFRVTNHTDEVADTGGDPGGNPSFAFDFGAPAEDFTCLAPIPAGSSCTFSVTFAPQGTGPQSTTVKFFAGDQTLTVDLTGTGTPGDEPAPLLATPRNGRFKAFAG